MSGSTGIDLITATENLRIATANRDIALNSVNVMKTYVASVEATLVGQQFASEGRAAAHWAQVTKFEESIRDAAVIRVKAETPIEAINHSAAVNAESAASVQQASDFNLNLQHLFAINLITTTRDALVLAVQVRQDAIELQESTHSAKVQAQQAYCDYLNSSGYLNAPGNFNIQVEKMKLEKEANRTIGVWQDAVAARIKAGESQTSCENAYNQAVADAIPITTRYVAAGVHRAALNDAQIRTHETWVQSKTILDNDQLSLDGANGQIQVASTGEWKDRQAFTKELEDSKAILVTRQAALATEQALVDAAQTACNRFSGN